MWEGWVCRSHMECPPQHGQGTPHPITRQSLAKGYPRGHSWLSLSTGKAGCQVQPAFW